VTSCSQSQSQSQPAPVVLLIAGAGRPLASLTNEISVAIVILPRFSGRFRYAA
jgi:hypothetical protein